MGVLSMESMLALVENVESWQLLSCLTCILMISRQDWLGLHL